MSVFLFYDNKISDNNAHKIINLMEWLLIENKSFKPSIFNCFIEKLLHINKNNLFFGFYKCGFIKFQ